MIFLIWIQKKYKVLLFILCLLGACFSVWINRIQYIRIVKHLDIRFDVFLSGVKKVEEVIYVDSDVSKTTSKMIFFARNNVTQERYKVTSPLFRRVSFGDCLYVQGSISVPRVKTKDFSDETLSLYSFPYREYLAKDDTYLLLQVKNMTNSSECESLSWYSKVELFFMKQKERFTHIFLTHYERPYAGLAAGVLVAGKGLLDKESLEMFKKTSLSHTVVLSGSNISIILICIKMFVDGLFFWRREKGWIIQIAQKIIIMIVVWAFVLLTGGGAPIYRAVASAYCGMMLFQEKTSQVYALVVTVLILTIISPFQTLYDPSFHLTCCATLGLILFSKPIDDWMRLSHIRIIPSWLREIMSVTLATQVFVFPYIVFMTSSFSSVFLISNMLVLPMLPFVMFFGFITLCADLLSIQFLVSVSVYVNNILLHTIFYIVKILSHIPYAYIVVTKTTSIRILIVYIILLNLVLVRLLRIDREPPLNNTPV